mmetsp:Transcript_6674/g.27227  ORF Transcript_6674/g.27227 Transcript_6674/m.27227 type:complete len:252 (-) Transcript_6674:468-1223(-)
MRLRSLRADLKMRCWKSFGVSSGDAGSPMILHSASASTFRSNSRSAASTCSTLSERSFLCLSETSARVSRTLCAVCRIGNGISCSVASTFRSTCGTSPPPPSTMPARGGKAPDRIARMSPRMISSREACTTSSDLGCSDSWASSSSRVESATTTLCTSCRGSRSARWSTVASRASRMSASDLALTCGSDGSTPNRRMSPEAKRSCSASAVAACFSPGTLFTTTPASFTFDSVSCCAMMVTSRKMPSVEPQA